MGERDTRETRDARSRAVRDGLWIAAASVLSFMAALALDLGDGVVRWIQSHERIQADEVAAVLLMLPVVLGVFSYRRIKELRRAAIEREHTESRLIEARERYRKLVERLPAAIYIACPGADGRWTYVSPQIETMLGFTPKEWTNDNSLWFSRLHPDDRDRVLGEEASPEELGSLPQGPALEADEYRMIARDGRIVWVRDDAVLVQDEEDGQPVFHGVLSDISDTKKLEEAFRAEKERKDAILRSALDCIVSIDGEGLVVEFNPAAEKMFGYKREDVLGREMAGLLIPPSLREKHRAGLKRYLEMGTETILGRRLEISAMRADGEEFPIELAVVPVTIHGAPMFTGYLRDMTEAKRLEEQLRQSQRMDAVGRLAGGIAHDFNNLLAVIINYAGFLKEDLDHSDPRLEDVQEIEAAGQRAAALVRQLLTFSRRGVIDPQVLDVNDVVTGMQRLLRRTLSEDISFETVLDPQLQSVRMDNSQLEQVLVNLAVNARDAMPRGGNLLVETCNVEVGDEAASMTLGLSVGEYACIKVSDTGAGIAPEVASHIFEPFFTTKPPGEGTGLGLATVYGVVTQVGGHVAVYSEPKVGTIFKVYLPVTTRAETSSTGEEALPAPVGNGELILVAEDEDPVRELVQRILVRGGYRVVTASSGREALEVFERSTDEFDMLLTDVIMPEMSGKELFDELNSSWGGLPTLFMSGYTDQIIARRGLLMDGERLLEKPFTSEELLDAVHAVVGTRGGAHARRG